MRRPRRCLRRVCVPKAALSERLRTHGRKAVTHWRLKPEADTEDRGHPNESPPPLAHRQKYDLIFTSPGAFMPPAGRSVFSWASYMLHFLYSSPSFDPHRFVVGSLPKPPAVWDGGVGLHSTNNCLTYPIDLIWVSHKTLNVAMTAFCVILMSVCREPNVFSAMKEKEREKGQNADDDDDDDNDLLHPSAAILSSVSLSRLINWSGSKWSEGYGDLSFRG